MEENSTTGWKKLLEEYPWFRCDGCFPITAYSEYMPPAMLGYKPYGKPDHSILSEDDPFGWKITEMEEEYELKPGIEHIGQQIMKNIIKLGKGLPEHFISGHGGENLRDNPYWPPELAGCAGSLSYERYVTLLPLMLSRTQDDKGRVIWTFFGNSIHDPEQTFWKSFFTAPGIEIPGSESFFTGLLSEAYGEKISDNESLFNAGFRILSSEGSLLPAWTKKFLVKDDALSGNIKYLLTFLPFKNLPEEVKNQYLSGNIFLLPFPGSLVFWGMPGYLKLKKQLPVTAQIPLLNLVSRNRGIGSMRVTQSGWLHEPHAGSNEIVMNENLVHDTFHRTHRWQRVHRYQDELNEVAHKIRLIKALFSTEPDAMGLYNKPMACNSQLWNSKFDLLLNGPGADRNKLTEVEKILLKGGLFGYRFFYPPMRVGNHEMYLHRPLVAFEEKQSEKVEIKAESLYGYITGYNKNESDMLHPVELWPRMIKRELYLSALHDFNTHSDHYAHQTSLNIISLIESWKKQKKKPLTRSFAHNLLNISKHKSLEDWLNELDIHAASPDKASAMREALNKIIEPQNDFALPEPLTYSETANRRFEEAWWNDIRFLSQGEFIYKDNADIMLDETTLSQVHKKQRDIEFVGDYFIKRYKKTIADASMEGKAIVGELPFKWDTLFDFSQYGGWVGNQKGTNYERNILMIIPGKNHKQAVVFGDHYDTAYMEDIYEKGRGGTGARLAADGSDDNYSASATLLQAAPIFLNLSKQGKLERDIWLIHLTGEEFPADCMGARNFCQKLVEKNMVLRTDDQTNINLAETEITGVYVMDMIGHNRDNDQDIFQISPGKSSASLNLARQAHIANMIWNSSTHSWNMQPERLNRTHGKRITGSEQIPETAKHLSVKGEVRTQYNPHSSIFNTDGQIFSDTGVPVVLFMENYDINRSGYHDTKDTMENIDLDYGAAFAAIAIETVARVATEITKFNT
ncbi:MAG: M28 family peptidase [Bacteroidetes bacterium]|nr:MAG: M28 family peptidase [Bacteroidota bacterium]